LIRTFPVGKLTRAQHLLARDFTSFQVINRQFFATIKNVSRH
jgi:hypothetical protein